MKIGSGRSPGKKTRGVRDRYPVGKFWADMMEERKNEEEKNVQ